MNTKDFLKTRKLLVGIVAIIAVFIIILAYRIGSRAPISESPANTPAQTSQTATSTAANGTGAQKPAATQRTSGVIYGIKMVTPALGESWTLDKIHTIRWTTSAGSTGSIELLDASSGQIVGWVTPNISAFQTSFDWDTRMVSISRMSPSRKDIAAGNYILKIVFDSSRTPVESVAFPVITSTDEKILTHLVSIQNGNFVPNFISIKAGESLVILNNDASNASMTVQMNGVSLMALAKNSSYVFKPQSTGTYEFRLKEAILGKLTVTAQ